MKRNLNKLSTELITEGLVQSTIDVNELNLAYETQRKALQDALKKRPNILAKVKEENKNHFYLFALSEDYKYFIYIPRDKYTDELVQKYLEGRIQDDQAVETPEKNYKVRVQKSLDNKILFKYNYITSSDDELYYFDEEFKIPLSLKSSIKVSLKLVKPLTLINSFDLNLSQFGFNAIKTLLVSEINSAYKSQLSSYIKAKKVGYYTLCASSAEFEEEFKQKLNKNLKEYGLEVKDFAITKLSIPQETRHKIEDQAFRIRQRKADLDAETEFAKQSLANYEQKLAIQQKYPDAEHSLTEYEKDLALKRFLVKAGKWSEEQLDHSNNITDKVEKTDKEYQKEKDVIPEIPVKKNIFKSRFIGGVIWCSIISILSMIIWSFGVGMILLGVSTFILGTIAALNYSKFKDEPIQPNAFESEYDASSFAIEETASIEEGENNNE